jgi:hypothetical protein
MFVSPLTPEQWADVRRRRAAGASFDALAGGTGIKARSMASRARREGWFTPTATETAIQPAAPTPPKVIDTPPDAPAGPTCEALDATVLYSRLLPEGLSHPSSSTARIRRALSRRLFRILDIELVLVELRMLKRLQEARNNKDAPITSSGEDLRSAQAVMKAAAEATETKPDTDLKSRAGSGAGGKSRSKAASEADVFRREIAERLEKLIPPA